MCGDSPMIVWRWQVQAPVTAVTAHNRRQAGRSAQKKPAQEKARHLRRASNQVKLDFNELPVRLRAEPQSFWRFPLALWPWAADSALQPLADHSPRGLAAPLPVQTLK